jgi:hypothetical protein
MSEWQPIETAPKIDGDRLLVVKDCGHGTLPSQSIAYWISGEWHIDSAHRTLDALGYRATHWMPLPKPPSDV